MGLKEAVVPTIISAAASVMVALISTGALKSELRSDAARLEPLPVGTVVASMLNETQFTKTSDGVWVLADGRNVAGSQYAEITTEQHVPDLRGYFLRGLDADAKRDPDGKTRRIGSIQTDALQLHAHDAKTLVLKGNRFQHSASPQGIDGHSRGETDPFEYFSSMGPRELAPGGSVRTAVETRPSNVAVYYYIKIKSGMQ